MCTAQAPSVENSTNDFPLGAYAPWNVTANHTRTISFTTTEGTALAQPPIDGAAGLEMCGRGADTAA
jgi:hypothetical protein